MYLYDKREANIIECILHAHSHRDVADMGNVKLEGEGMGVTVVGSMAATVAGGWLQRSCTFKNMGKLAMIYL